MSRDVKMFVVSCDICQKAKPKRQAPFGMLQPLPIPENPFEVVTMDFIMEFPTSLRFDSIWSLWTNSPNMLHSSPLTAL
jgi:hypothetical protein